MPFGALMNAMDQAQRLLANLLQLGGRKLAALAAIGVAVFAIVGVGGYYLSRPANETLYSGLDRQDIASIGAALHDADIGFDVSSDGTTVSVRYGQTAQARMLLAEKGLPHSSNAGYELYDKMGSLGLTSFMQDVTRVRALEGELARTIQSMAGIRAARVHVVLPDEGSFRRARQPPSASVVIRASMLDDAHVAGAIRHLVASAVPGMTIDEVTVLSTDGTVLASGDDATNGAPSKMLDLEKVIDGNIAENIRRTLAPSLGAKNLQVSVTARLNTDTKQTAETSYNPDGRVERSTRTVKETVSSQNSSSQAPAGVGQNLPQAKPQGGDGKNATEQNDKREELNNYEVSSKTTTTVSTGYTIDRLSIAVVINRAAFVSALGDKVPADAVDKKLADVEQLVGSAAGFDKARGDSVKVMAVDFVDNSRDLEPMPSPGIMEAVSATVRHPHQRGPRSGLHRRRGDLRGPSADARPRRAPDGGVRDRHGNADARKRRRHHHAARTRHEPHGSRRHLHGGQHGYGHGHGMGAGTRRSASSTTSRASRGARRRSGSNR